MVIDGKHMAWTADAPGESAQPPRWNALTLPYLVERGGLDLAGPRSSSTAHATYGELRERADGSPTALVGIGIEPIDRVALLSTNWLEYLEIELGISARAGDHGAAQLAAAGGRAGQPAAPQRRRHDPGRGPLPRHRQRAARRPARCRTCGRSIALAGEVRRPRLRGALPPVGDRRATGATRAPRRPPRDHLHLRHHRRARRASSGPTAR